ncbi:maleylpyruvate isomerase family mycothiol-dependent enzyme [Streptomyces sp. NPDC046832]|uniref:maleylpyruvate isomerase family mycothiol-dependent enzyme n=1 Tax=Streptomyces sp. NPDC046832 TaxID=3155020 RepID=UPI0033ED39CE
MIDHAHDLASVRDATERLLTAVGALDNAAVTEPSRLPGWSRGHVLAHLARNADALVNVLRGRPMYASGEARDADIERDAPRALDMQLADLRESAARFQEAGHAPADWTRTVELRNGVTDSASRVPFRRWVEVELHHVDLGIGYELEDLPADFTEREIDFLADRFTGHPDVPATRVTDGTRAWRTGRKPGEHGPEVTVTGTPADLLGWLAGRRDGSALSSAGGPLPALPPL